MLGKGPEDPASSYPEYNHLRKVALQSSAVSQCMTKSKSGQHFIDKPAIEWRWSQ